MNTQTVYKVCCEGQSWSWETRRSDYSLTYKIGCKTVPKVGKIFTFKTLKQAFGFAFDKGTDNRSTTAFFEGEGENPHLIKVATTGMSRNFSKFWSEKKSKKARCPRFFVPKGTIAVDSFTPIKEYTFNQVAKMMEGKV
jgi:hypothetical protein